MISRQQSSVDIESTLLLRLTAGTERNQLKQLAAVVLATARIAAEHGSFNRIREVTPICTAI